MKHSSTRASKEALCCIGSNCGDREANVAAALQWLSHILSDFRHSPIYATPDCRGGHREYMNAVGVGLTEYDPAEFGLRCKEYELSCGRTSAARAVGDVPVDIDLVVYEGQVLKEKDYRCEFFIKGYLSL